MEGTKVQSTVQQRTSLRKTGRHIPTEASQAGRAGHCSLQLLPQISREERQREGERGGHASRNGTTCIYLTVVLYST